MKVTTERLADCEVKLVVEIDSQSVEKALRQTARQLAREMRFPGFRPGKAPFDVVLRRFGREALIDETLEKEGQGWYEQALEEVSLEPFGRAQLETTSYDPLVLTFSVPVEPVIELGSYRDIRLEWQAPQVTDEDVGREMQRLQQQKAKLEPVERVAQLEDVAVLDVQGRIDDELVVDLSERPVTLNPDINYPVIGFAEKIVGMSPGQERTFTLTYPENHANAAWAGREAQFEVHMHGLKAWAAPELTDALAQSAGDYSTLIEWRAAVRQELQAEAEHQAEHDYADRAVAALAEQASIEFPAVMVERELDSMLQEMDQSLQQRGLGLDNFLVMTRQSQEDYRESLRDSAKRRVQRGLALAELIRAEGLAVSEAQVDAEIERMAQSLGDEAEKFREFLAADEMRDSVRNNLLSQAAVDTLKAIVKGEYTPPAGRQGESLAPDAQTEAAETQTPENV
ncbi:MAG: trigger factor [Chloroflexota bacterium]